MTLSVPGGIEGLRLPSLVFFLLSLVLAAELSGEETAQTIQLFVEYDPRPPFDAGSPRTAPAHLVAAARSASRHTAR